MVFAIRELRNKTNISWVKLEKGMWKIFLFFQQEILYLRLCTNHKGESVGDEVEYVDGDPEDQERPPDEDQQLLRPSQPVDLLPNDMK